ncbi:MAG: hypothetical protein ACTSUE_25180 [Promethearchaeota archaeon]
MGDKNKIQEISLLLLDEYLFLGAFILASGLLDGIPGILSVFVESQPVLHSNRYNPCIEIDKITFSEWFKFHRV